MNGRNCVKDLCNTHPLYLPHQSHAKNLPLHFRSNESCDWLGCCSYHVKPVHDLELIEVSFFFFFFLIWLLARCWSSSMLYQSFVLLFKLVYHYGFLNNSQSIIYHRDNEHKMCYLYWINLLTNILMIRTFLHKLISFSHVHFAFAVE